ncbi:MAG: hypothetical protein ISS72_03275 [Candidatus Brocadiae bacterium]|nr:hypothetical protein [Candidatus Brocadiia bacterium]
MKPAELRDLAFQAQAQIAELQQRLTDAQEKLLALQETNAQLREQLSEKQRIQEIGKNLVNSGGFFFMRVGSGEKAGPDGYERVPYCPNCYRNDARIIRLIRTGECPACRAEFGGSDVEKAWCALTGEEPERWEPPPPESGSLTQF